MEKLEEHIHLRNIVSCLKEISDYSHYLSYDGYILDNDLKKIINNNLSLAAQEANCLYQQGCHIEGIQYLAGLADSTSLEEESFAVYSLLQNDIDYMTEHISNACIRLQNETNKIPVVSIA